MKDISYLFLSIENLVRELYMGIYKYYIIKLVSVIKNYCRNVWRGVFGKLRE